MGLFGFDQDSTRGWYALGILIGTAWLVCICPSRQGNRKISVADSSNRWHVFTAIGGYIAVAIVDLVMTGTVREDPTKDLAWPLDSAARVMKSFNAPEKQA